MAEVTFTEKGDDLTVTKGFREMFCLDSQVDE